MVVLRLHVTRECRATKANRGPRITAGARPQHLKLAGRDITHHGRRPPRYVTGLRMRCVALAFVTALS